MMGRPTRYDAWIIGTHELPDDLPASYGQDQGQVAVLDKNTGKWSMLNADEFNELYEWA